ncbi:MAG: transglutaminase domain-containing protein [Crenarchaeota archaeon]|nr:transglutaminase domain-containing protein [Thermoproteota archaeon]
MRALLALAAFVIAYLSLEAVSPLDPGALTIGDRVEVPYSWDFTGPKSVLASVSPPEPQWLRVASFTVYTGRAWLKGHAQLEGLEGGEEYVVSVTPYAIMLYPAFPVPQPAPGTVPRVEGAALSGDAFVTDRFTTKVWAKYSPPFPYADHPELSVRVALLLGEPKEWSTPRVQQLAKEILDKFKDATLRDLLNYLTTWLRSNYRYALKYSGAPAEDPVDWFLFVSKTGMCVHFASAAAVLLNDMGIRARVVYGFANSYLNGDVRVFVTPTHLWVEVWTPRGWVPWDPSPPMSVGFEERRETPQRVEAPALQAQGGGAGAAGRAPQLRVGWLLPVAVLALLYGKDAVGWLRSWPLAFRRCAERRYGVRGLTLRELGRLTGIEELKEAQEEFLRSGKWPRRGLMKALALCLRWSLRIPFRRR